MIGLAQADRWTCPDCGGTEVPDVAPDRLHRAIRNLQLEHASAHAAERVRAIRLAKYERRGWISLSRLLVEFRPGSHGPDWTWEDETADLLSHPCLCPSTPPNVVVECGTPGHYQLMLEDHLRERGRVEQPICLGVDGRVWDGHHRVVAAIRLGFDRLPVEKANAGRLG